MAGKLIEVTTNILKADISEIDSELRAILQCADKLAATLGQLESMWDGSAKEAFSLAVKDDLNRLKELVYWQSGRAAWRRQAMRYKCFSVLQVAEHGIILLIHLLNSVFQKVVVAYVRCQKNHQGN